MITKLKYMPLPPRKLLYNALIKYILEYCLSVLGNTTNNNSIKLLRIQKRCARPILDTNIYASSVKLCNKQLGWIPIDDITVLRKLCIMFNIINGKCPDYFDHYICYVNTRHNYETRASTNVELSVPFLIPRLVNVHFLQVAPDLGMI